MHCTQDSREKSSGPEKEQIRSVGPSISLGEGSYTVFWRLSGSAMRGGISEVRFGLTSDKTQAEMVNCLIAGAYAST